MALMLPDGEEFWAGVPLIEESAEMQAWFLQRVAGIASANHPTITSDQIGHVARWFTTMARPESYLVYVTSKEFRGAGCANGHWTVRDEVVIRDLPKALAWSEGNRPPDADAALAYLAKHPRDWQAPREVSAYDMVRDVEAFHRSREAIRDNWPWTCRRCGGEFHAWRRSAKGRVNTQFCKPCREAPTNTPEE